jgi:hypothetical protein
MNIQWRREILFLLVVAMDVCWLAPLTGIIGNLMGLAPLPVSVLPFLYLAAFWSGRLVIRLRLDTARGRVVAIYLAAMAILAALKVANYESYPWLSLDWLARLATDLWLMFKAAPPALLTIVTGVLIWWNGLRLSGRQMNRALVASHFTTGLILLVLVLLLAAMRGAASFPVPIFAFFAVGLMAVSIARLETMASGRPSPVDRYWVTVLTLVILLVTGVGLVVISAFSAAGAVGDAVMVVLTAISSVVGAVLLLLVTPFGYLAYWLIAFLMSLGGSNAKPIMPPEFAPYAEPPVRETQTGEMPFILEQLLRAAPMIILLIVAVWLLSTALNRRRGYVDEGADEFRESTGSLGDFWSDLLGFLGRILGPMNPTLR